MLLLIRSLYLFCEGPGRESSVSCESKESQSLLTATGSTATERCSHDLVICPQFGASAKLDSKDRFFGDKNKICELYSAGVTTKQIAARYGVCSLLVARWLKIWGIIPHRQQSTTTITEAKDKICELYQAGESLTAIAAWLRLNKTSIGRWLKIWKVTLKRGGRPKKVTDDELRQFVEAGWYSDEISREVRMSLTQIQIRMRALGLDYRKRRGGYKKMTSRMIQQALKMLAEVK